MTRELDEALQSCLELIRGGKETIESAAARYPEFEDVLKPQLVTALWITSHRDALEPRPEFVSASRRRLVSRIRQESPVQRPLTWLERLQQAWTVQQVAPVAFVFILLLFLFVSGTVVSASKDALPGDDLYNVKRSLEEIALATTIDEETEAELNVRLTRQRLEEWMILFNDNRINGADTSATVIADQITRTLESIDTLAGEDAVAAAILARKLSELLNEQQVTLAGLQLRAASTSISPAVEKVIQVTQRGQEKAEETRNNSLALLSEPVLDDTRMPPPTATRTAVPTRTPIPTKVITPTLAPEERVDETEKPDPTATKNPTPTHTPTPPPPTPTPVPTETEKPPADTDTPTPTETPTPTPTDTPTPTETPTPTPTDTPVTPSPTPVTPSPTPTDTPVTPTAAPPPTDTATAADERVTPTPESSISDPGNSSDTSSDPGTPVGTSTPDP